MMKNPAFDDQLEQAIIFLVTTFQQSGNNPKPVILHSIRVALFLYEYHYPEEVIIAGALHDLVEDTNCLLYKSKRILEQKSPSWLRPIHSTQK